MNDQPFQNLVELIGYEKACMLLDEPLIQN